MQKTTNNLRGEHHLSSFKVTVEKKTLETERKNLRIEMEELKRMADAKGEGAGKRNINSP